MKSQFTTSDIVKLDKGQIELRAENLSVTFGSMAVLKQLTFSFNGPGLLLVIGPNGAGKTTLIKVLAGILRSYDGSVEIGGLAPTAAASMGLVGYVPQTSASQLSTIPITAIEVVMMGISLRGRWPRRIDDAVEAKAALALSRVGVKEEYWEKRFSELSGGMKQRVLIARALAGDPPLLLLDEPLSNIDPLGRNDLACLIGSLSEKKTIVMTSHDPVLVLHWTKALLVLGYGLYVYGRPEEVLEEQKLFPIYGESTKKLGEHLHISDSGCRL